MGIANPCEVSNPLRKKRVTRNRAIWGCTFTGSMWTGESEILGLFAVLRRKRYALSSTLRPQQQDKRGIMPNEREYSRLEPACYTAMVRKQGYLSGRHGSDVFIVRCSHFILINQKGEDVLPLIPCDACDLRQPLCCLTQNATLRKLTHSRSGFKD